MNYKELMLRSDMADTAVTELIYEIASGRADQVDLMRINVDATRPEAKKIMSQLIKLLKSMKQKGSIQFFATQDNFECMSTEAVFLVNKYHDLLSNLSSVENQAYFFIKM